MRRSVRMREEDILDIIVILDVYICDPDVPLSWENPTKERVEELITKLKQEIGQ